MNGLLTYLTGAALLHEREHGTVEHLLVMPLTAFEIAMAKVWANSLVILIATAVSLFGVVEMALKVPFAGVAELVDALVLGTSIARCGGSSPFARTISELRKAGKPRDFEQG